MDRRTFMKAVVVAVASAGAAVSAVKGVYGPRNERGPSPDLVAQTLEDLPRGVIYVDLGTNFYCRNRHCNGFLTKLA